MQLIEYFTGRWLAWAIGIPAAVAILVAGALYGTTTNDFAVTAETSVLRALPSGSTPFDIDIFTEQVVVEFDSEAVRSEVMAISGMSRPAVISKLDAVEVGNAGSVAVSFVGDDPDVALSSLRGATATAMQTIAQRELAALELTESAAASAVGDLRDQLIAIETAAGSGDIEEGVRELRRRINTLDVQRTTATTVAQQRSIEILIEAAREQELALMENLPAWRSLRLQLNIAEPEFARATLSAAEGRAIVAQLANDDLLTGIRTEPVSRVVGAIRGGISAGVLAAVLTVGTIVALQYRRRRADEAESTAGGAGSAVEVKEPVATADAIGIDDNVASEPVDVQPGPDLNVPRKASPEKVGSGQSGPVRPAAKKSGSASTASSKAAPSKASVTGGGKTSEAKKKSAPGKTTPAKTTPKKTAAKKTSAKETTAKGAGAKEAIADQVDDPDADLDGEVEERDGMRTRVIRRSIRPVGSES